MPNNKKEVKFSNNIQIYYLHHWHFAHRQARKSNYLFELSNRIRFEKKIKEIEQILERVLKNKIEKIKNGKYS